MNASQLKALHAALLSAFPTRAALARMVRFGLDVNLATIADGTNLDETVFSLIEWAEGRGRLSELLTAARDDNPGNASLRAFDAPASPQRAPEAPPVATPAAPAPGTLTQARRVLASLFPSASRVRIVAVDAGLELRAINFNGSAEEVWASVLDEADRQNRRGALLAVARGEYPNNPELQALRVA